MATIYTHIDNNKRNTVVIMALFVSFVSAIGWFIGEYYFEGSGLFFVAIALIFSGLSSFVSYYYSDSIVLAVSGAHEVTAIDNTYLHNLVENLCIGAGLPKPRVFMINDTAMNAFATGRDPQHAVICFTSGIVDKLEKLELEGVVAHELSHIGSYDIRLMSIVSVLVGTTTLLADWFTRGIFYGGGRRRSSNNDSGISGIILLIGIAFVIVSPIVAVLIQLAISRNREYLADSSAALLTRYPKGLADALVKISSDKEILEAANGATAHLYITNPLKGAQGGFFAGLFNTHPEVNNRIKRLLEM